MIFALCFCFIFLFVVMAHNWKRSRLFEVLELIPNRLLTRYPLVFASGKRSLFYFLAYWNSAPHWLASHGYEVFHLNLAWKDSAKRQRRLLEFLKEYSSGGRKVHLIIDQSSYHDLSQLLYQHSFSCLASVTLAGQLPGKSAFSLRRLSCPIEEADFSRSQDKNPLFWRLHLIWTSQKINTPLSCLGWRLDHKLRETGKSSMAEDLLNRAQFLAERDFRET